MHKQILFVTSTVTLFIVSLLICLNDVSTLTRTYTAQHGAGVRLVPVHRAVLLVKRWPPAGRRPCFQLTRQCTVHCQILQIKAVGYLQLYSRIFKILIEVKDRRDNQ